MNENSLPEPLLLRALVKTKSLINRTSIDVAKLKSLEVLQKFLEIEEERVKRIMNRRRSQSFR